MSTQTLDPKSSAALNTRVQNDVQNVSEEAYESGILAVMQKFPDVDPRDIASRIAGGKGITQREASALKFLAGEWEK